MAKKKRKKQADDGLSELNYQTLNEDFYAGEPADFFERRLHNLLVLKGEPEAIQALMDKGIDVGGVHIERRREAGPGSRSEEEDAEGRDRFFTAEAWLLLHHVSETLLRLYLAHAENDPCPALNVVREREPGGFKKKVRARFVRTSPSPKHHSENGLVFYGSPTVNGFDYDTEGREALLSNIESLMRLFASTFLDAEAYNAIKHSMAIRTGNSRLEIKVDEMDLGTTEGPHIEYVGIRETEERFVWAHKTRWFDFDLIVAQIATAQRMILALWLVARHRYIDAELQAVPNLQQPTADELRRSDSVTWFTLDRDLIYDPQGDEAGDGDQPDDEPDSSADGQDTE
jgi:hypothetical protein